MADVAPAVRGCLSHESAATKYNDYTQALHKRPGDEKENDGTQIQVRLVPQRLRQDCI